MLSAGRRTTTGVFPDVDDHAAQANSNRLEFDDEEPTPTDEEYGKMVSQMYADYEARKRAKAPASDPDERGDDVPDEMFADIDRLPVDPQRRLAGDDVPDVAEATLEAAVYNAEANITQNTPVNKTLRKEEDGERVDILHTPEIVRTEVIDRQNDHQPATNEPLSDERNQLSKPSVTESEGECENEGTPVEGLFCKTVERLTEEEIAEIDEQLDRLRAEEALNSPVDDNDNEEYWAWRNDVKFEARKRAEERKRADAVVKKKLGRSPELPGSKRRWPAGSAPDSFPVDSDLTPPF